MHFLPCPQHAKHSDSDNVWMTHTKIYQNKFTFPQILHLSSNRRVRNLTFYFQFTTPARKLTHRTKFEHAERHEFWKHHNSLLPWAREMPKSYPERHKFRKHHVSSPPWARETPKKTDPERHEFWQRPNSSLPWARESPKSNHEIHEFHTKLHSLTPAKMPRKVFIFPEFRTSFEMHSLTPSTLTKQ